MCEPATPRDILKRLGFELYSLVETMPQGSCERAAMALAMKGAQRDLDWCLEWLEQNGEGGFPRKEATP